MKNRFPCIERILIPVHCRYRTNKDMQLNFLRQEDVLEDTHPQ